MSIPSRAFETAQVNDLLVNRTVQCTGLVTDNAATNLVVLNGSQFAVVRDISTLPGSGVSLASTGAGEDLVNDGVGPVLAIKSLTNAGTVTLTDNTTDIEISAASTDVALTSAGGTSLVTDGLGPSLAIKGLTNAGTVTLTNNANDIEISAASTDVTLSNAGGGASLVSGAGTGPALATKSLTAGTDISFNDTATDITINSTFSIASGRAIVFAVGTGSVTDSSHEIIGKMIVASVVLSVSAGEGPVTCITFPMVADEQFWAEVTASIQLTASDNGVGVSRSAFVQNKTAAAAINQMANLRHDDGTTANDVTLEVSGTDLLVRYTTTAASNVNITLRASALT